MTDADLLTASEIRALYADAIRATDTQQLNYLAFYQMLREKGLKPKGMWPKEHHRSIYNAVTKHPDFVKVAPGVFALAHRENPNS